MTITQKDVAAAAGVSQALVSLVLSEKAEGSASRKTLRVSPETRQKIIGEAHRLGYRRKALTRSVQPGKTLLYLRRLRPDAATDAWMDRVEEIRHQALLNALIETVSQYGFALTTRLYHQPHEVFSSVSGGAVDGVILGRAEPELLEAFFSQVPVVILEEKSPVPGDAVVADQQSLLERALDHLVHRGHTRIALLAAHSRADVVALRKTALETLSERLGIDPVPSYEDCTDAGDFWDRFLDPSQSENPRPTAVIAEEPFALAIQNEAIRRGLSLPRDLSLIGLGASPASAFSVPSLTTVDVDPAEVTRAALSLILERLKNQGKTFSCRKIEVAASLIERDSVAVLNDSPALPARSSHFPSTDLAESHSFRSQTPKNP